MKSKKILLTVLVFLAIPFIQRILHLIAKLNGILIAKMDETGFTSAKKLAKLYSCEGNWRKYD